MATWMPQVGYRPVPRRLIIVGDRTIAEPYVARADLELAKLESELRAAKRQFPNQVKQLRRARLFGNVAIECFAGFGESWVKITVRGGEGAEETVTTTICLCAPCFALGIITAVNTMTDEQYLDGARFTYDIDICLNGKRYVAVQDQPVRSAGWEQYSEGQIVLVTLDAYSLAVPLAFDCCAVGQCLMHKLLEEDPTSYALTIAPFTFGTSMKKWITSSQTRRR